ncbi:MAG: response regulator transcription factor [Canibacter sp.]
MRILICEDSTLLREGLVRLLEMSGHTVVAALSDTEELPAHVAEHNPDVCILDVRLPPTWTDEGIRAAISLRETTPKLPILVLSQYVEERYAADLVSTQSTGLGYLLKDRVTNVQEFLAALEQIASGGTVLDPEVVSQLLTRNRDNEKMQRLTDRERAVLAALSEGKSNQAIATELHLSPASIEKHITSIFQKLELEQDDSGNRRVLAVLAHLNARAGWDHTEQTQ